MRKNLIKIILSVTGIMACLLLTYKPAVAEVYTQFQSIETRSWNWDPNGGLDTRFRLTDSLYDVLRMRADDPIATGGEVSNNPDSRYKFFILADGFRQDPINAARVLPNDFRLYPNPINRPDANLDDGYAEVNLGFTYRFNAKNYTKVYVSINGFVTFEDPTIGPPGNELITRDPNCLFINDAGGSIPQNVIAPYWGDHKYWPNTSANNLDGKAPSEIGYVRYQYEVLDARNNKVEVRNAILIQWKDLNVNWCKREYLPDGQITEEYLGNVASFQLIIYEGPNDTVAQQGDVEFRYGAYQPYDWQLSSPNGHNVHTNPNNKAAVGTKGMLRVSYDKSDFINALYCKGGKEWWIDQTNIVDKQRNYTTFVSFWQPSGDPGLGILLKALHTIAGDTTWGDGDADMSRAAGGRHSLGVVPQNRFVTLNDIRTIMLASVTGNKLDSIYKQAAFHADVNHDGRFYFLTNRNSGIFRYNWVSRQMVPYDQLGFYNDPDNVNFDPDNLSRDTFFLRKVGVFDGKFGFNEYYGRNGEIVEIDFIDAFPAILTPANSVRKFKLVDRNNFDGLMDFDYQFRIVVIDDGIDKHNITDRQLLEMASQRANLSEMLRIKLKKNIVWKDSLLTQNISDLPGISNPYTEIYYETNELDASLIMSWLGGQIGWLPWIWENPDHDYKGKQNVPFRDATNIVFNNEKVDGDNIKLPIYYNGAADNNQAVKFNFNTDVVNIESANSNVMLEFSNDTKTAVIISNGYFNPNNPIAYVTLPNDVNTFEANNVRFYGNDVENVSYKLSSENVINNNSLSNNPNPASIYTEITVNIPETGTYKLAIYDNNGNLVSEIANSEFEIGVYNFTWDCSKVVTGTYFYTLEGTNTSVTKSLIIAR